MRETREIKQTKMFKLFLNPITANAECKNLVAISYNKEELMEWYEGEKTEGYREGQYYKNFKKGSPIENYNPFFDFEESVIDEWVNEGSLEAYLNECKNSYGFMTIPYVLGD